jgi:hypothetical protein
MPLSSIDECVWLRVLEGSVRGDMGVLNPKSSLFSSSGVDITGSTERFVNSEKLPDITTKTDFDDYIRKYRHGWFYEHGRDIAEPRGGKDLEI